MATCCSSARSPTKQVPNPSSQAVSSICCKARPASKCGRRAAAMAMAMTNGAVAIKGPWVAMRPNSAMVSGLATTIKFQGWELVELGDQRPARRILRMTLSGTGSGL